MPSPSNVVHQRWAWASGFAAPRVMVTQAALALVALTGSWFMAAGAQASEINGMELAKKNACLACHQVDSRRVGPPFQAIAERYGNEPAASGEAAGEPAGDREATLQYLAEAIQKGGRGRWGAIPMPAQPQVSQKDARDLAEWILSLSPNEE